MKIFGTDNIFGIDLEAKINSKILQDDIPEVKVSMPASKGITQIPRIITPVNGYNTSRNLGRGQFICPEYDLAEVGRVEDTESFVRQAFDKKVALMFKEGYDLVGRNPRNVKYIKIRLAQIARASGEPTVKLLRDIGSSLIRKSNAILVKVRNEDASGGKVRSDPTSGKDMKPIAAYFPAPVETMEVSLNNNKIVKWRQNLNYQQTNYGNLKEYNPQDIVHFYYDRKDGFIFGTPQLVPVLDDIRALRKIEENIELLVYQYLFPLFQFKVGTENMPAGTDENGEREIDVIRREIQFMPSEGGLVTTERHEIQAIGAEGKALDAKGYLDHFKKRVIAGLGISAVDLGDGDTTNRATSDNMSRNLIDSVKDFQQVIEYFFNELIIAELLLESTFGDDVLDEDNRVWLKFKEIDIDAQIKKEAHMADQFAKNLVSQDEARLRVGYEPMRIPTPDDMQSMDPTQLQTTFPEWNRTFFKLFQEPLELIKAAAKPDATGASMAAGEHPSTTIQPSHVQQAHEQNMQQQKDLEKIKGEAKVAAAKAMPKPPRPKAKDAFVSTRYEEVEQDVVNHVRNRGKLDHDWVAQIIRTSMGATVDYLIANQAIAFRSGYDQYGDIRSEKFMGSITSARIVFRDRAERYIDKLTRDVISSLKRNVKKDNINQEEIINLTRSVFDTLKYRTDFIEYVELKKARSLGLALSIRDSGQRIVFIQGNGGGCDRCKQEARSLDSFHMIMDDVPPFHANCECRIVVEGSRHIHDHHIHDGMDYPPYCLKCVKRMRKTSTISKYRCDHCGYVPPTNEAPPSTPVQAPPTQDYLETMHDPAAKDVEELIKSGKAAACPKCTKTALLKKDTPDIYNCRACGHSFRKE